MSKTANSFRKYEKQSKNLIVSQFNLAIMRKLQKTQFLHKVSYKKKYE